MFKRCNAEKIERNKFTISALICRFHVSSLFLNNNMFTVLFVIKTSPMNRPVAGICSAELQVSISLLSQIGIGDHPEK